MWTVPTPSPHPAAAQCTYCIVPFTRGAEQSRTPEAIRREMLSLGEAGYREVTLLGQNVDAYGRDLPGFAADGSGRRAWTFTDLLRYVHDVPGGRVGPLHRGVPWGGHGSRTGTQGSPQHCARTLREAGLCLVW